MLGSELVLTCSVVSICSPVCRWDWLFAFLLLIELSNPFLFLTQTDWSMSCCWVNCLACWSSCCSSSPDPSWQTSAQIQRLAAICSPPESVGSYSLPSLNQQRYDLFLLTYFGLSWSEAVGLWGCALGWPLPGSLLYETLPCWSAQREQACFFHLAGYIPISLFCVPYCTFSPFILWYESDFTSVLLLCESSLK